MDDVTSVLEADPHNSTLLQTRSELEQKINAFTKQLSAESEASSPVKKAVAIAQKQQQNQNSPSTNFKAPRTVRHDDDDDDDDDDVVVCQT